MISVKTIGGITYREFLLDANQEANAPISLIQLELYQRTTGNASDYSDLGSLRWQLTPTGASNQVILSGHHGSGSGDMYAYIPDNLFDTEFGNYVYLYSKFGLPGEYASDDGFEEWAVQSPSAPVPEPGTLMLIALGMLGLAVFGKRKLNRETY